MPAPTTQAQPRTEPLTGAPLLRLENIHKTYSLGRVEVPVLHGVSLGVSEGEFVAVLGASGSGKSTLLHIAGGLDNADADPRPTIRFRGRDLARAGSHELDVYRNRDAGFIFQFYHLLPELTVTENVLIGAMIGMGRFGYMLNSAGPRREAAELLDAVGLSHRLGHRPAELSGGERQRVAIARALMNKPSLLLADEPTGNLDHATGEKILDALGAIRRARRLTLVVATHDPNTAARADRVVHLRDGLIASA